MGLLLGIEQPYPVRLKSGTDLNPNSFIIRIKSGKKTWRHGQTVKSRLKSVCENVIWIQLKSFQCSSSGANANKKKIALSGV